MRVYAYESKGTTYWKKKNGATFISFLLQIHYLQYCGLWNAVKINWKLYYLYCHCVKIFHY